MAKVCPKSADVVAMKAILSVAIYLALVFALGCVMAFTAKPADGEMDGLEDES
jgi:hypothetical protein